MAHQTRRSGRLLCLVSMKSPNFCQEAKFQSPCQSVFFSPIIILFLQYSHKRSSHVPEMWPIQGLMFNILFQTNCILLRSLFVFVKGRGTCGSGERNVKIWIDFRKSPRFSLTSPLSQEREKWSRPVFTMCGEPCTCQQIKILTTGHIWYQNTDR